MATGKAPKTSARPVPTTRAALVERFKDFPAIDVLERRLDNPNDPGTLPLILKDEPEQHCVSTDHWVKQRERIIGGRPRCLSGGLPFRKWYVRWINLGEHNRWNTVKARGYVPVEVAELSDENAIADLHVSEKDTYVRRGERGLEVLHKMPLAFFLELQHLDELQRRKLTNAKTVKRRVTEDAGRELGSEAGDLVDDMKIFESRRHKTTLREELDAMEE